MQVATPDDTLPALKPIRSSAAPDRARARSNYDYPQVQEHDTAMRWNFSSRARELSNADVFVISIPKSGRTWVRTFLASYFAAKTGQPFSINLTDQRRPGVPRIVYSHDQFEYRTKGNAWDRLRGKYLIPRSQLYHARVLLLARDPRDAFASYYVQMTRRNPAAPNEFKQSSVAEVLRHSRFGIAAMVRTMNGWLTEFRQQADFRLIRYEDLQADPGKHFAALLSGICEEEIAAGPFDQALAFSTFENMQELEASGGFANKILTPRDVTDIESFKVRKGKIGGYREYLSGTDQEYATRICRQLDPQFGYA